MSAPITPNSSRSSQSFDVAFDRVKHLLADFQKNEKHYCSPDYSEAQVRKDYIDKFWIALGWDVNHETQTNPYEQDVKVERGVAVSASRKRADYAFLAPNFRDVLFYVEARRPHGGLDTSDNYFQTIRYGWNSQNSLAVLTDFENLRVLDSRYKPDIDTALLQAVKTFHYSDYFDPEKFKEIYYLFSREAVANGSIDKFAATLVKPTGKAHQRILFHGGYQRIDELFLQELDGYREELARSFKNSNPRLNSEELTEVTQRTLDRLVFMRFLEDKLIETEPLVERLGDKGTAWQDFISTSHRLDGIYNGIIFKKHALLDSPELKVDERMFAGIREKLAHTNSPYDFNTIPIHVLGSIYERFLGKVIVATEKRARVEEKPEVRKAGGVYYTPEYIVRYIVANTVGKFIEGKTPKEIQEMRFADIACGSGSFLLGVYDTLLRHHTAYYNRTKQNRKEGINAGCIHRPDGVLQLSLLQKRQILLRNVHGVDIDPQAVEVAQLSLYLKLLEDETTASAHQQQIAMREALLPSLSKNIVCGNSLVGWDINEGKLFDMADERGLNPMNFEDAFPEVMKGGGFDAIVGNPPYIRPHKMDSVIKKYLWRTLKTFVAKSDIYSCFMEKGLNLLRGGGYFGLIVPHTWTSLESFEGIRRKLVTESEILLLAQLPKKVFQDATVETCIFAARKSATTPSPNHQIRVVRLNNKSKCDDVRIFAQADIAQGHLYNFQLYTRAETTGFASRLKSISKPLSDFVEFVYGFKTADDEKFIHADERYKDSKPFIRSAAIHRYSHDAPEEFVWYVPAKMKAHRLTARPGEAKRFESEKVIVARMGKGLIASYDAGGLYVKDAMLLLPRDSSAHSLKYLLALINSRLLGYFYQEFFITIDVLKNAILDLPIRQIDFSNPADKTRHDRLVQFVEQMLGAKKQLAEVRTERHKTFYENKCANLDRQIDELVYELYGLTAEEIDIVEATSPTSSLSLGLGQLAA